MTDFTPQVRSILDTFARRLQADDPNERMRAHDKAVTSVINITSRSYLNGYVAAREMVYEAKTIGDARELLDLHLRSKGEPDISSNKVIELRNSRLSDEAKIERFKEDLAKARKLNEALMRRNNKLVRMLVSIRQKELEAALRNIDINMKASDEKTALIMETVRNFDKALAAELE